MLPVGDSPRAIRTPWINLTLIAINVLAFLYELSLGPDLDPFLLRWGVVPTRISAALAGAPGDHRAALLTLVTATFLHGGWLHIGGNMLFLWIFGDNVEDRLGHLTYLLFYLACGVVANLVQVYADPTSTIAAIGASGAIAGVLGAYAITYPGASVSVLLPIFVLFWVVDVPALILIGVWFVTQFFSGVASLGDATAQTGGIAWWAHVGGFLFGVLLMLVLPKSPAPSPVAWPADPRQRARQDTGLVGLAIGTVSLISQLVQLALMLRLVEVFFGLGLVARIVPAALPVVYATTPLVRPFALLVPPLRFGGHVVETYSILAILVVYLVGAALIWVIAALAYPSRRAYARRPS
jgi:membrane associated rhomboid family serine protease